jgi:hypothetical protein
MTVLLTPIAIVLGPSAADSNARTGTALPINLSHRECRPFQFGRLTQSRRHLSNTGRVRKQIAVHSPALTQPPTATATEPWSLSP